MLRLAVVLAGFLWTVGNPSLSETVIANAVADFDGDGRRDALEIVMTRGRRYVDETVWCGMSLGGEPKFEGQFVARVRLRGKPPVDTDLNDLFEGHGDLWFNGSGWKIFTADLKRNGRLQFTLGQYGACKTWSYFIFEVTTDGRVERLSPELFNGDHRNSTDLRQTNRGFLASSIPESEGDPWGCREYRWNRRSRTFVSKAAVEGDCN